jgi:quercetin dioxygenase-like cupin family protein
MKPLVIAALSLLAASPALAAEPAKPTSVGGAFDRTVTGQPLVLPQGPVTVTFRVNDFPAGARLPVHRQPYQRYAYILSGRLRVTYVDENLVKEFGPGEVMVEGVNQWHFVEAVGPENVKVMTIDQTPPGKANVELRPQPTAGQ